MPRDVEQLFFVVLCRIVENGFQEVVDDRSHHGPPGNSNGREIFAVDSEIFPRECVVTREHLGDPVAEGVEGSEIVSPSAQCERVRSPKIEQILKVLGSHACEKTPYRRT